MGNEMTAHDCATLYCGATLATGFFGGFFFSARVAGAGCAAMAGAGCTTASGSIVLRTQEPPTPRIEIMH